MLTYGGAGDIAECAAFFSFIRATSVLCSSVSLMDEQQVKNHCRTHWQITQAHGQLQSPESVILSVKADELMRFSAPTPQQLASL